MPDWESWFNEGAGVAIADISGNGQPDLLVFRVDAVPDRQNAGYYRIGWDIDAAGRVTGWSPWLAVPDWFPWFNAGADVTVADVDGDGVLDLVVLMVDGPAGRNQGYYRSGPLNADGTVTTWRTWSPSRIGISGKTREPESRSPTWTAVGRRSWLSLRWTIRRSRTAAITRWANI